MNPPTHSSSLHSSPRAVPIHSHQIRPMSNPSSTTSHQSTLLSSRRAVAALSVAEHAVFVALGQIATRLPDPAVQLASSCSIRAAQRAQTLSAWLAPIANQPTATLLSDASPLEGTVENLMGRLKEPSSLLSFYVGDLGPSCEALYQLLQAWASEDQDRPLMTMVSQLGSQLAEDLKSLLPHVI